MARKVIDIIYNLIRKRMTLKGDGTGITTGKITSLPNSAQVERGMQTIFNRLKQGGYNVVSAEKVIKNEDDLARILEEINQAEIAQIKRRKDASEGIETVIDKMNRGIPLNPGDQAKIEGAGMKTTLDAFRGFEPKVIPGGKMSGIEAMKEANLLIARKGEYKNISESDAKTKLNELQEIINKANAEPDLGTKLKNFDGDPDAMAMGGRAGFNLGGLSKLLKMLSAKSPVQRYKDYLASVKKRSIEGDFKSLAPELGAVSAGGILVNRKMKSILEEGNELQKERFLKEYIEELNDDPSYKDRPELKDKLIENYTKSLFGQKVHAMEKDMDRIEEALMMFTQIEVRIAVMETELKNINKKLDR